MFRARMSVIQPGPFSLSFTLGRIPVVIQPTFWLMAWIMGASLPNRELLIWIPVVLVSILVHELGHALAFHLCGTGSAIELYAFGGLCRGEREIGRWQDVFVSLAGPFAGFALGGAALLTEAFWIEPPEPVGIALWHLMYVNFFWGLMNLMPVLPLDGGHVLAGLLGPRRRLRVVQVCGFVGAAIAIAAASWGSMYMAILFGLLSYRNLAEWWRLRPKLGPQASAEVNEARIRDGWTALHAGNEKESARLGKLVLDETRREGERAAALDLLAWSALAMGEPTHALSYLRQTQPPGLARALTWALALDASDESSPTHAANAAEWAQKAYEQEPSDTSASLAIKRLTLRAGPDDLARAQQLLERHAWQRPGAKDAAAELVTSARAAA